MAKPEKLRLGEILVRQNVLTEEALELAKYHANSGIIVADNERTQL